jgi:trans-aconitate 2-methyltransferase
MKDYLDVKKDWNGPMWDPGQYRRFADERSRPFADLLARVRAEDPRLVLDLGCGPGDLTAALARRWPAAEVRGVDNSAEMIAEAQKLASADPASAAAGAGRLSFILADVRQWQPDQPADVIISNAVLQWIPGHLDVVARWAGFLAPGGWLAIQVPANFDQPSHAILRELASSARWRRLLAGVRLNRQAAEPAEYLDLLARAGLTVDAWETTYLHVLPGEDPVLEWYRGTGLRPVLAALSPGPAADFTTEYGARMRAAYPVAPYGTVLPFRRVFAVAVRA